MRTMGILCYRRSYCLWVKHDGKILGSVLDLARSWIVHTYHMDDLTFCNPVTAGVMARQWRLLGFPS